jgi:hypothetical protein
MLGPSFDGMNRALRTESASAIKYWFGIDGETVWRWKTFFGVGEWEPEGSRRLHQRLSLAGAAELRGKRVPPEVIERRRQTRLGRKYKPPDRWKEQKWTKEQLALLGKLPDEEVAARIGRTTTAVRIRRTILGIASARDRRRRDA